MLVDTPLLLGGATAEAAARADLRDQIARLDRELAQLGVHACGPSRRGPRLLSLAELERVRDELAERAASARRMADSLGETQEHARRALEEVLLDPAAQPLARVSRGEIGEPGCGTWEVRPRLGLLGMLMRWWRVKISSGCPLSGAT